VEVVLQQVPAAVCPDHRTPGARLLTVAVDLPQRLLGLEPQPHRPYLGHPSRWLVSPRSRDSACRRGRSGARPPRHPRRQPLLHQLRHLQVPRRLIPAVCPSPVDPWEARRSAPAPRLALVPAPAPEAFWPVPPGAPAPGQFPVRICPAPRSAARSSVPLPLSSRSECFL
jgi:hypothetical protein